MKILRLILLGVLLSFSIPSQAQVEPDEIEKLQRLLLSVDINTNAGKFKFMDELEKHPRVDYVTRQIIKRILLKEPNEMRIWGILNSLVTGDSYVPKTFPSSNMRGLVKKWERLRQDVFSGVEEAYYLSTAHKKSLKLYIEKHSGGFSEAERSEFLDKVMHFKITTAQKRQILREMLQEQPDLDVVKGILNNDDIENVPAEEMMLLYKQAYYDVMIPSYREEFSRQEQVEQAEEGYRVFMHPDVVKYLSEETNRENLGVSQADKDKVRSLMQEVNSKKPFMDIKREHPGNIDAMTGKDLRNIYELRLNTIQTIRVYYYVDEEASKVYYLYAESKQGKGKGAGVCRETIALIKQRARSLELIEGYYYKPAQEQPQELPKDKTAPTSEPENTVVEVDEKYSDIENAERAYSPSDGGQYDHYKMYSTVYRNSDGAAFVPGVAERLSSPFVKNVLNATDDLCRMVGVKVPARYYMEKDGVAYAVFDGEPSAEYLAIRGIIDGGVSRGITFSALPMIVLVKLSMMADSQELKAVAENNGLQNCYMINSRIKTLSTMVDEYNKSVVTDDARSRLLDYLGMGSATDQEIVNLTIEKLYEDLAVNGGRFSPRALAVITRDENLLFLGNTSMPGVPFSLFIAKNKLVDLLEQVLEVKNNGYDLEYYRKPAMKDLMTRFETYRGMLRK